jgi:hypothetical protein
VNAGIADIAVNGRQGTWRPRATFGPVPGLPDVASRSLDDGAESGVLVRSRPARRSLLDPKRQGEVGRSRRSWS